MGEGVKEVGASIWGGQPESKDALIIVKLFHLAGL